MTKICIVGRLVKDPELRYTKDEIPLANFVVGVRPTMKGDEKFYPCIAWRGLANIVGEYCNKGSLVAIEGKVEVKKYEVGGKKKEFEQVVVENMLMLDKKFFTPPSASGSGDELVVMQTESDTTKKKIVKIKITG